MSDLLSVAVLEMETRMLDRLCTSGGMNQIGEVENRNTDTAETSFTDMLNAVLLQGAQFGLNGGLSADATGLAERCSQARNFVGVSSGGQGVSDALVNFITEHEGYSSTPYRGTDYWNETVGYGHVVKPGENIQYLSRQDALELLKSDIQPCIDSVSKEFAGTNLTQPQFDALVSFSYQLGTNIWPQVPHLVNDIRSGASAETLKQDFASCDHCGGEEVQGLLNRRMDEWKMFTSGEY